MSLPPPQREPQPLGLLAALLLIQLAILLVSLALVPYRLVCAARSLLRTRSPREPAARDQKVFSEAQR